MLFNSSMTKGDYLAMLDKEIESGDRFAELCGIIRGKERKLARVERLFEKKRELICVGGRIDLSKMLLAQGKVNFAASEVECAEKSLFAFMRENAERYFPLREGICLIAHDIKDKVFSVESIADMSIKIDSVCKHIRDFEYCVCMRDIESGKAYKVKYEYHRHIWQSENILQANYYEEISE